MLSNDGTIGNQDAPQNGLTGLHESFLANFPVSLWGDSLIVGVSGGSDSVALAHLVTDLNRRAGNPTRICLAHVNHCLRGAESDREEQFVANLARELDSEFHSWQVSLPDGNLGEGLESRLRDLRYRLLVELARERSARCIALAHHRDDQIETILFRIFRGTSLRGLGGIPVAREIETGISLVRPLIEVSRQQILDWLADRGLACCTDSSNLGDGPTRNWIRNQLLPQLSGRFGESVRENIAGLAGQAIELTEALNDVADRLLEKSIQRTGTTFVELDPQPLVAPAQALVQHLLVRLWTRMDWPQRDMTREKWESVAEFIRQNPARTLRLELPGKITATVKKNGIVRIKSNHTGPTPDGHR